MQEITIGNRKVGPDHPPFIIAEMSGNHNQSLDKALAIVDAAAGAGADAIKLQTYTADTMTIDLDKNEFKVEDPASPWNGYTLYRLYDEAHTPWEWHRELFERGRQHGLVVFSTPFDSSAVVFLEELNAPCYKVASFENTDMPLIRKIAATGKPMIVSTGMATVAELSETVRTARESGCKDLILLKCTSNYPASPEYSHVRTIPHMQELFDVQTGLSDHTLGVGAAIAAVALGATVIEKHLTLSRAEGGVDAAFSMEPAEFKSLVEETRRAWQAMGKVSYGVSESETRSSVFRRSLYIVADLKKGDKFSPVNLRAIRPGYGLPTKFLDVFLGKRAARDVKRGTPLSWDLLE
jgi:pseudaminic acid synthase